MKIFHFILYLKKIQMISHATLMRENYLEYVQFSTEIVLHMEQIFYIINLKDSSNKNPH